ncbi:MAG TPA: sulfite exporter TauE/SafE family protein [Acidimicrobiia bacterium]|nr:sulfite exporter TauE/SafE family protein [Acidimicrobiia bacterium]
MNVVLLVLAAAVTSGLGAMAGVGGAILLVPLLVVTGTPVSVAAPLGLISVAALSIAAAPTHLEFRVVNHRLGLTTEVAATAGAVVGALVSDLVPNRVLVYILALAAIGAALAGGRRKGIRNRPDPSLTTRDVGERVGVLSGAYPLGDQVVPYSVRRVRAGLGFMTVAGLIAGTAGVSGGFIKTPATSELMHVPTKVAAATTTFTIGITAASALTVFAVQGRIDTRAAAAIIVGSFAGSLAGARLQARLVPQTVRAGLSVLLVIVAVVMVVTA